MKTIVKSAIKCAAEIARYSLAWVCGMVVAAAGLGLWFEDDWSVKLRCLVLIGVSLLVGNSYLYPAHRSKKK